MPTADAPAAEAVPEATTFRRLARPGADPLLAGTWLTDPEVLALLLEWRDRWEGDGAAFDAVLARMDRHAATVAGILAEGDLPPSLVYLPLAESRYDPEAVSRSGAVGLWQLMAPTARGLGLGVTRWRDERTDPARSTEGAVEYLRWLHARYDSWPLALVGYNAGPGRLDRLLAEHVGDGARGDRAYVALFPHLHDQARHFVPRFVAALLLAEGWAGPWWLTPPDPATSSPSAPPPS